MQKNVTKKMALTAMLACLAFVLNTFVYFPAMAPFQHCVDVIAAVLVGPWYGFAAALLCGIMRMLSGRTIQAVTGAIYGPILGGLNLQEDEKYLSGMDWRSHRNRIFRSHVFLSVDENVLRTGCPVPILLYSVLYPVCSGRSSYGCGNPGDLKENGCAWTDAE